MVALQNKETSIALALAKAGADLNAKTENGFTVATAAVRAENPEVLGMILAGGFPINSVVTPDNWTLLHVAAYYDCPKSAEALLSKPGINIDARVKATEAAIHIAAEADSVDVLKLLLKHGANVNTPNSRDIRPLHHAALKGSDRAARMLLAAGADPTLLSKSGVSALDTAERSYKASTAEIIRAALKDAKK
jgi:ankyrin repeat protein